MLSNELGIVYLTDLFFCLWLLSLFYFLSLQCDGEIEHVLQWDAFPEKS